MGYTYGLILDLLGLAALEGNPVALVLETLGGDQTLDLGSLGVRLLALALGLDLATDDVLADLYSRKDELCISLLVRYISDSTLDRVAQPQQSTGQAMTE